MHGLVCVPKNAFKRKQMEINNASILSKLQNVSYTKVVVS